MKRTTSLAGALAALAIAALAMPASTLAAVSADSETQFLSLLNADRSAAGLPPLAVDSTLSSVATQRAQQEVAGGTLSHYDSAGNLAFQSLLNGSGLQYTSAGENLAENSYPSGQSVTQANSALMASPTHAANILNPNYNAVGVAVTGPDPSGHYYFTEIFGQLPQGASSASTTTTSTGTTTTSTGGTTTTGTTGTTTTGTAGTTTTGTTGTTTTGTTGATATGTTGTTTTGTTGTTTTGTGATATGATPSTTAQSGDENDDKDDRAQAIDHHAEIQLEKAAKFEEHAEKFALAAVRFGDDQADHFQQRAIRLNDEAQRLQAQAQQLQQLASQLLTMAATAATNGQQAPLGCAFGNNQAQGQTGLAAGCAIASRHHHKEGATTSGQPAFTQAGASPSGPIIATQTGSTSTSPTASSSSQGGSTPAQIVAGTAGSTLLGEHLAQAPRLVANLQERANVVRGAAQSSGGKDEHKADDKHGQRADNHAEQHGGGHKGH